MGEESLITKQTRLKQCHFSEHLLEDHSKAVAIVESEKSAIVASAFFPDYLWLATGGISNLTQDKFEPLKDRNVILFPDCGAYGRWEMKYKELTGMATLAISDLLLRNATKEELEMGYNIADYLLRNSV